ncbi:hypothetical protein [Paenibacillus guangzhouensis]|uniref:hypothetical protein n=1 Tax=Paenibacillus guangzhouensis TaxID=1473112 RepID=UPI001267265C|nr:hypothetical protein [Paenibacillus guangzhouensis]
MQPYRSKGVAFFASFIPGLGHYYVGKKVRAVLYAMCFFGALGLGVLGSIATSDDAPFAMGVVAAFIVGCINMLDMIIYLIRTPYIPNTYGEQFLQEAGLGPYGPYGPYGHVPPTPRQDSERFFTILLSFVPGLGHFYLGLMHRGLSFLIAFFGLGTMLVFVAAVTNQGGFAVFLGLLPIIWLYCMFDAVQAAHRKQQGDLLLDRTLFDDFDSFREDGRRSKMLAMVLSLLPGAGHMYLGLQRRGLQLMVGFLGSIYILDFMRLSLFFFFIPLIWCFSFFDTLQQLSRYSRGDLLSDTPVVRWLPSHNRWLGFGLILIGAYYMFDQIALPMLENYFPNRIIRYQVQQYFQTLVIALLFIGGGVKLLFGSRRQRSIEEVLEEDFDPRP